MKLRCVHCTKTVRGTEDGAGNTRATCRCGRRYSFSTVQLANVSRRAARDGRTFVVLGKDVR
jgi:hypothetical protein